MKKTYADFSACNLPDRLPFFQPFNDKESVRIYSRGFLPHWRQDGCTYFVTFRAADSIPKQIYRRWKYERDLWLKARNIDAESTGWKQCVAALTAREQLVFQRSFAAKLFSELDKCQGACVFRDVWLASIVADAIVYFHGDRMLTGDFVIMPNHIHALITPINGYELEDVLHSIKSFSANKINEKLGRNGEFWMPETHDHLVRDWEELMRIQDYIRNNPAKAGLKGEDLIVYQTTYKSS